MYVTLHVFPACMETRKLQPSQGVKKSFFISEDLLKGQEKYVKENICGAQSLKYLLSDPWQEKQTNSFLTPNPDSWVGYGRNHTTDQVSQQPLSSPHCT